MFPQRQLQQSDLQQFQFVSAFPTTAGPPPCHQLSCNDDDDDDAMDFTCDEIDLDFPPDECGSNVVSTSSFHTATTSLGNGLKLGRDLAGLGPTSTDVSGSHRMLSMKSSVCSMSSADHRSLLLLSPAPSSVFMDDDFPSTNQDSTSRDSGFSSSVDRPLGSDPVTDEGSLSSVGCSVPPKFNLLDINEETTSTTASTPSPASFAGSSPDGLNCTFPENVSPRDNVENVMAPVKTDSFNELQLLENMELESNSGVESGLSIDAVPTGMNSKVMSDIVRALRKEKPKRQRRLAPSSSLNTDRCRENIDEDTIPFHSPVRKDNCLAPRFPPPAQLPPRFQSKSSSKRSQLPPYHSSHSQPTPVINDSPVTSRGPQPPPTITVSPDSAGSGPRSSSSSSGGGSLTAQVRNGSKAMRGFQFPSLKGPLEKQAETGNRGGLLDVTNSPKTTNGTGTASNSRWHRCYSEADVMARVTVNEHFNNWEKHVDSLGDGSKPHALPSKESPHINGLKVITAETMSDLLAGKYTDSVPRYAVVDCRYPYEYSGGHVSGAHNHYTESLVYEAFLRKFDPRHNKENRTKYSLPTGNVKDTMLGEGGISDQNQHPNDVDNMVLIFYCEFSSKRGPSMLRFLRKCDRQLNRDAFPELFYPEIYLLEDGYKKFYESGTFKHQCEPPNYLPMNDESYADQLKFFRSAKSKSWSGPCGATVGNQRRTRKQSKQLPYIKRNLI